MKEVRRGMGIEWISFRRLLDLRLELLCLESSCGGRWAERRSIDALSEEVFVNIIGVKTGNMMF